MSRLSSIHAPKDHQLRYSSDILFSPHTEAYKSEQAVRRLATTQRSASGPKARRASSVTT